MSAMILPGSSTPLGATPGPEGTNFAVSSGGDEVTLCLFDGDGAETRLVLPERDGDIWHGFTDLGTYPRKAEILAEHCAAVGRDPATIERSAGVTGSGDALLADADAFVALGVTFLTVGVNGPDYDLSRAEALCRWRDRR